MEKMTVLLQNAQDRHVVKPLSRNFNCQYHIIITSVFIFITSPLGGLQSIVMSVSVYLFVCLSVHSHNLKTTRPNFTKIFGMLPMAMA